MQLVPLPLFANSLVLSSQQELKDCQQVAFFPIQCFNSKNYLPFTKETVFDRHYEQQSLDPTLVHFLTFHKEKNGKKVILPICGGGGGGVGGGVGGGGGGGIGNGAEASRF